MMNKENNNLTLIVFKDDVLFLMSVSYMGKCANDSQFSQSLLIQT